jgi:hypothetical protein
MCVCVARREREAIPTTSAILHEEATFFDDKPPTTQRQRKHIVILELDFYVSDAIVDLLQEVTGKIASLVDTSVVGFELVFV